MKVKIIDRISCHGIHWLKILSRGAGRAARLLIGQEVQQMAETMNIRDDIMERLKDGPINQSIVNEIATNLNNVDIAESFEELSREIIIQVFRLLPKDVAADVFSYLEADKQQLIVESLTDAEVVKIIEGLFSDDAADFIEEMPANVVKRVLRAVSEETRRDINQLLQYPDDSAGSIMTTEFVDLKEDTTVAEAFEKIRKTGVNKETIYTCFVIRYDRVLLGTVSAKTLLLANPKDRIGDIMEANPIFAYTTDDQEDIAAIFRKYGFLSLPIVDKENRLVGLVTIDDIVQVIEEEATEDIHIMAAINPSEEPYLKTGIFRQSRNRIVWLLFLMLSATLTGIIITGYQESWKGATALIASMPLLMGTAGNAGAQTSTLIVRGIALGEISVKNLPLVLWREIRIALLCGSALAVVNFFRILIMNNGDITLGIIVSLSLVATVVVAKIVGCTLPIAAKTVKIDPAIMAAPLLTTIADAISLLVYFSIATLILRI